MWGCVSRPASMLIKFTVSSCFSITPPPQKNHMDRYHDTSLSFCDFLCHGHLHKHEGIKWFVYSFTLFLFPVHHNCMHRSTYTCVSFWVVSSLYDLHFVIWMNGIEGIGWGCFSWILSKTNSLDLFMVFESEYFIDTQGEICPGWTELAAAYALYIKKPRIAVEHFYSPLLIWLYFIIFWILSYFPLSLLIFFLFLWYLQCHLSLQ